MLKYACLLATAAALRPSAPVGTRSGFGGRRLQADLSQLRDASFEKTTALAKMTASMPPFLKKLGIEKPEDAVQMLKDKAADLDVSSATAFAEKNLDIVKAKQSAASSASPPRGLRPPLRRPTTTRPASSRRCERVVGGLIGMLLTLKIFNPLTDVFAVLLLAIFTAGGRGGKLYLDSNKMPAVTTLTNVNVGSLKWPAPAGSGAQAARIIT
ncbi:hypothetical protein SO694_00020363 [Aureococcus anophagefferens]|uniref:Uncharacterized protein n=1 Tax=Aureococcus anophagefferens TaxID=44056 RepID=A0ABR1FU81_AURAN